MHKAIESNREQRPGYVDIPPSLGSLLGTGRQPVKRVIPTRAVSLESRQNERRPITGTALVLLGSKPGALDQIRDMSMGEIGLAVFRSRPVEIGKIEDIGPDGLTFRYIEKQKPLLHFPTLDILLAEKDILLKRIPVRVVSDEKVTREIPDNTIYMRRRRVRFVDLSYHQMRQLRRLIDGNPSSGPSKPLRMDSWLESA